MNEERGDFGDGDAKAAEKVTELVPPNSNQHSYEQLPCSKFNYSYKAIHTGSGCAAIVLLLLMLMRLMVVLVVVVVKLLLSNYTLIYLTRHELWKGTTNLFSFSLVVVAVMAYHSILMYQIDKKKSQTMIACILLGKERKNS